jgi:pimeloyl-ACP methyl ester carboxylesterase
MRGLLSALALIVVGCSSAMAAETYAYGPDPANKFDLYKPDPTAFPEKPYPLTIFIHGGAFVVGDKVSGLPPLLLQALLDRGFAVSSINYRLRKPFPAPMYDGTRALKMIRFNHNTYEIDPSRVILMGGSAGAGIAQWIAYHPEMADPNSPSDFRGQSTRVRGVAVYNAQTTYTPGRLREWFGSDLMMPQWIPNFLGVSPDEALDPARQPEYDRKGPYYWYTVDDPPAFYLYHHFYEIKASDPRTWVHRQSMLYPMVEQSRSNIVSEVVGTRHQFIDNLYYMAQWAIGVASSGKPVLLPPQEKWTDDGYDYDPGPD